MNSGKFRVSRCRIYRLEITNFKKYVHQTFELHPQFTLFVGENGSGKTTVLDALAVAASIWLVEARTQPFTAAVGISSPPKFGWSVK